MPSIAIISGAVGDRANLSETASFTVPNYQTATLHCEYLIQYDYKYSLDNVAVFATSTLDGAQVDHQERDDPSVITFSMPFTLPVGPHSFHFGSYSIVDGPGYSRFNGILNVWLEYDSGEPPDGSTTPPPDYTLLAGVTIAGVVAAIAVYWFGFRKRRK